MTGRIRTLAGVALIYLRTGVTFVEVTLVIHMMLCSSISFLRGNLKRRFTGTNNT